VVISFLYFVACSLADILGEVGSLNTSTQPQLEDMFIVVISFLLIVACSLADILGEVGTGQPQCKYSASTRGCLLWLFHSC
jgi:hypothetical protein